MIEITVALIASVVAIMSSVIAELVPAWNSWEYKRVTQIIVSLIFPIVVWVAQCSALDLPFIVTCDFLGFVRLAGIGVSAVLANAGSYHLAVRPALAARHKGCCDCQ